MVGGAYLSYEAMHKIWGAISGHGAHDHDEDGPRDEDTVVAGAVRTDLILSTEIMLISLASLEKGLDIWTTLAILAVIALLMTGVVYGAVALIVKMDDVGLSLSQRAAPAAQRTGLLLVKGMPKLLAVLSTVGVVAMLWVGGHILLVGADELGWHGPYALVHAAEEAVHAVPAIGGVLAWLANTLASALIGLAVGALVVAILHLLPRRTPAAVH